MKKLLLATITTAMLSACAGSSTKVATIDKTTLVNDINYLASDELKGRKSFTPEIDMAADYIVSRFKQIGLTTLAGLPDYKQSFSLYQIKPTSTSVVVNGEIMPADKAFVIASRERIDWNLESNVNVTKVGADDDFRAAVNAANQQGGQHVIFVDESHSKLVGRYHNYFSQGQTKSKVVDEGALAVVLTSPDNVTSFSVQADIAITEQPLANVVGVLPGKSKADEMVIFSGHYDHLGEKEGKIYNGADDNASGTSAFLSLAQYFADLDNNERTLVFVGFTAEEMGLLGSENFTQFITPEKVAAMINIEMIGKPSKFGPGRLWITGAKMSNLKDLMNTKLPKEQQIEANPYPTMNLFYRSDNASLAKLGVPAHSFSSVQLDGDKHYHQSSDEVGTLDMESYFQAVKLLSVATEPLVTGELTPSRVKALPKRPEGKIY